MISIEPVHDKLHLRGGISEMVFTDIVGGLGCPDLEKSGIDKTYSACVSGRREDDVVVLLGGFSGRLDEFMTELTNLKDRLYCRRWYRSREIERSIVPKLRKMEGFTYYEKQRKQFSTEEVPVNPPETWPHFRNYEFKASLIRGDQHLEAEFNFAVQEFESDYFTDRIEKHTQIGWVELEQLLSRPFHRETLFETPLQAAVYAWWPLRPRPTYSGSMKGEGPAYGGI